MRNEEWESIAVAPKYLISNLGRIKNLVSGRYVKHHICRGYPTVNLENDGVWFKQPVHRLIASAFVDGEKPGLFVNHIDGDKTNFLPWNLEWVTRQGNVDHAVRTGLVRKLRHWTAEEYEGTQP